MPTTALLSAHPFAMLIAPDQVLAQVERAERLDRLQRRVCRPLDAPRLMARGGAAQDAVDAEIERDVEATWVPEAVEAQDGLSH